MVINNTMCFFRDILFTMNINKRDGLKSLKNDFFCKEWVICWLYKYLTYFRSFGMDLLSVTELDFRVWGHIYI